MWYFYGCLYQYWKSIQTPNDKKAKIITIRLWTKKEKARKQIVFELFNAAPSGIEPELF